MPKVKDIKKKEDGEESEEDSKKEEEKLEGEEAAADGGIPAEEEEPAEGEAANDSAAGENEKPPEGSQAADGTEPVSAEAAVEDPPAEDVEAATETAPPAAENEAPPTESEAPPAESELQPAENEAPPPESEVQPAEIEAPPTEGETAPADEEAAAEGKEAPEEPASENIEAPPAESEEPAADGDPALDGEPAHVDGEPAHVDGEPALVDGEPAHVDGEPAHVDGEPAHVDGEPAHVDGEAPAAEGEEPPAADADTATGAVAPPIEEPGAEEAEAPPTEDAEVPPQGEDIGEAAEVEPGADKDATEQTWFYKDLDNWNEMYKDEIGERQSPIDLPRADAPMKENPLFSISGNRKTTWLLTNTGTGLKSEIFDNASNNVIVTGGPFSVDYKFDHFEFHWGTEYGGGAQHTMDGFSYDGEIQYVFKRTTEGDDEDNEPYMILGLFMKHTVNKSSMATILEKVDELIEYNSTAKVENIDYFRIIKSCFVDSDYFSYLGSMTVPPFTENVRHVVFEKPGEFSENFFNAFRQFKDPEGNDIPAAHRPIQPVNDREIYRVKHPKRKSKKKRDQQPQPPQQQPPTEMDAQ